MTAVTARAESWLHSRLLPKAWMVQGGPLPEEVPARSHLLQCLHDVLAAVCAQPCLISVCKSMTLQDLRRSREWSASQAGCSQPPHST